MKDFHELILQRRSIRKYLPREISPEAVKIILEAALVAPSSKGKMPCQFIAVDDKDTLIKMSKCKDFGAKPIEKSVLSIIVTADATDCDTWIEDSAIAAIFMQLQAEDLGLGSCWIQIRGRFDENGNSAEEYLQNLLSIPDYMKILCIVTFGHKDEIRKPYETDKCKWEKVHIGTWKEKE